MNITEDGKNQNKKNVRMGSGRCPKCNADLGSAKFNWDRHDCTGEKNLPSPFAHIKMRTITAEEIESNRIIDKFMDRNSKIVRIKAMPTDYSGGDWNRLMKVVDEIEKVKCDVSFKTVSFNKLWEGTITDFSYPQSRKYKASGGSRFESLWNVICVYIKFYMKERHKDI